tara:strand:- start:38 stop:424 length:387 start_codon:yes stop_codon:yes gene_type:complete
MPVGATGMIWLVVAVICPIPPVPAIPPAVTEELPSIVGELTAPLEARPVTLTFTPVPSLTATLPTAPEAARPVSGTEAAPSIDTVPTAPVLDIGNATSLPQVLEPHACDEEFQPEKTTVTSAIFKQSE